ncbi:serine/threonine-protein kinase [Nannocystis bainbridge]|uniref:Protein kinase n=1 Tax=Nannocystis bainbridge TaxID=2995303 RepID=A0ABT5DWT6_9BACT|nr:serine/threonine protein kinase [Nannocystis bainbridge]MDC0717605.1 protein kinase [Nannocystis bainbridge]
MAPLLEQASDVAAWKPRSALLGTLLANRYRITQSIGQGSTGAVYRAEDLLMNRPVAVRILVPSLAQNPTVVSRIRARIDRNIKIQQQQPDALVNLVDAFDVGMTLEGELFIVTDFLDGDHLSAMLERGGRLPWSRARHLFIRLSQLLQALHERGIVLGTLQARHCYAVRNRPKNEAIKIVSTAVFEHIAANLGPGAGEVGTQMARYAAPEQGCGEPTDIRTDVYSLGIIAYELLTGKLPFNETNPIRLVAQHLHATPLPLRQVAPDADIPAAVEEVVLKALSKSPADRHPSMEAFAAALSAIPADEAGAPTTATGAFATVAPAEPLPSTPPPPPPPKPLASTLPVSSDNLSAPVPSVSSAAAAAAVEEPSPSTSGAAPAKIAPSVVMRGLIDAPATPPGPPPPPPTSIAPPPPVGPRRPPSIAVPTLIPSPRRPSEPVASAPVPSAMSESAADKPTEAPVAAEPPPAPAPEAPPAATPVAAALATPAAPETPVAAEQPPAAAEPPAPAAAEPPAPAAAEPPVAAAEPPPPSAAELPPPPPFAAETPPPPPHYAAETPPPPPPYAAEPPPAPAPIAAAPPPPPAPAAEPTVAAVPPPSAKPAPLPAEIIRIPAPGESMRASLSDSMRASAESLRAAIPADSMRAPIAADSVRAPAPADSTRAAAPADSMRAPISSDSARVRAAEIVAVPAALSAKPDEASAAASVSARRVAAADVAPETLRAAALRQSQSGERLTSSAELRPTESIIAELPKRRTPWVAIVGLGAALAAGAAAYIQTEPEVAPQANRAVTPPPAKIEPKTAPPVKADPTPIPAKVEPPPPDPVPIVAPPPDPEPAPRDVESEEPKKKKKRRAKSTEPEEEEEDLFDQVRKHMEAKKAQEEAYKKAAEAGTSLPGPAPTPANAMPAPAPKPAVEDNATKAKDTLDRARQAAQQSNHPLAYSLAKQANALARSQDAIELMGVSACKAGNADNARSAADQLTGARRSAVYSACAGNGITL